MKLLTFSEWFEHSKDKENKVSTLLATYETYKKEYKFFTGKRPLALRRWALEEWESAGK